MAHDHAAPAGHHDHPGHDHHDGLGHAHALADFGRAFAVGLALNAAFTAVEVIYGVLGHSVALLADAGHTLSDALGLGVAWAAVVLGRRRPTTRFTYGLGGASILAALFNAVVLLVVVGGLTWEAVRRLGDPEPVAGRTVMVVAACGIAVNGVCAWLFSSGAKGDLNVRGAFLHMAADALVSLGVVVAGLLILLTGRLWLDPLASLMVNAVIVWGTWGLLAGSLRMGLDGVPPGIDMARVRETLRALPGVAAVRDLHVWPLSTTRTALTCRLVTPAGHPGDAVLEEAAATLARRFGIAHVTLQPTLDPARADALSGCGHPGG